MRRKYVQTDKQGWEVHAVGPLAPFTVVFQSRLKESGHTPLTRVRHLQVMAHLSRWMEAGFCWTPIHHQHDHHRRRTAHPAGPRHLTGRGAHYIFIAKGNQPGLHRQLRSVPWEQVPPADTTISKGHGRVETRTVKPDAVPTGIEFPQAALAIQITRTRRPFAHQRSSREPVYAITDVTYDDITPAQLADAIRGRWSIENRLHWIAGRDLRRRPQPDPHRPRPTGHGHPALPRRQPPPPGRSHQHRRACRQISRHPKGVLPLIR